MFGSVTADVGALSEEDRKIYQGYYCGLCHALKAKYKNTGRLTLNYDMTFLFMFLSSYFNEPAEKYTLRCVVHPLKKKNVYMNKYAEYASDINILLTYYKLLDDWQDDRSLGAYIAKSILENSAQRAKNKYSEKNRQIEQCLSELYEIEKTDEHNPDIPANVFGKLMGYLFDIDGNDKMLYDFGFCLGKVIYIMDACIDLKDDIKKCRYNPMVEMRTEKFQQILTILLSDCTDIYDKMNIEKNKSIIDNILFSGIFQKFRRKYK